MRLIDHKSDLVGAAELLNLPVSELEGHAVELLEWLRDGDRPLAELVATALVRCGTGLVEPIRSALRSRDPVWMNSILVDLMLDVSPEVRSALADDVLALLNRSRGEGHIDDVYQAAMDVFILTTYGDALG